MSLNCSQRALLAELANIWGGFSSPKLQPRGQGQVNAMVGGRRGREEEEEEGGLSEAD